MQTVLVHGASIGELLAAEPVVARLRATHPDLVFVFSHTSPSVAAWPSWTAARVRRLPLPVPGVMGRWLDDVAPSVMLLSRGELWPAMLSAARRRGISVAVIGGRIREDSGRLRWPLRAMLAPGVRGIARIGAVTEADAARWRRLGALPERVVVTGDPGVDRLLERTPDSAVVAPLRAWARDQPVLVIGSMEPSDVPAVGALLADAPRAIVVPHNPERMRAAPGWAPWHPGQSVPDARVVYVARRGLLADCYHVGRAAYVGGGFAGRVHETREPAAAGLPVLTGPNDLAVLGAVWRRWRDDPAGARSEGETARRALEAAAGAATHTAHLVMPLLP